MAYEENKNARNYSAKLLSTSKNTLNGTILPKLYAVFTPVTFHFES